MTPEQQARICTIARTLRDHLKGDLIVDREELLKPLVFAKDRNRPSAIAETLRLESV